MASESTIDVLLAILSGKQVGTIGESRQIMTILSTAVAVLVGCAVVFVWRRSTGKGSSRAVEPPKPLVVKTKFDPEVDDGKEKVTIFFGTQTGTAEDFAKDDYAAKDEEYEEKLKKEKFALFFLATYGDGEPTDNAAKFYRRFTEGKEGENCLGNLKFVVFGLVNRQYEHFNKEALLSFSLH